MMFCCLSTRKFNQIFNTTMLFDRKICLTASKCKDGAGSFCAFLSIFKSICPMRATAAVVHKMIDNTKDLIIILN